MNLITIIGIGISLSMDTLAASITCGIALNCYRIKSILKIAIIFASCQCVMPLIGWLLGISFSAQIENYDHWIAFILLSALGSKMIYESVILKEQKDSSHCLALMTLVFIAIATSLDSLAVGLTFAFLNSEIISPALVIGFITFCFSIFGILLGIKLGQDLSIKFELIGGIILILIGCKILIEHLHLLPALF